MNMTVDIKGNTEGGCSAEVGNKPCRKLNRFRVHFLALAVLGLVVWHTSKPQAHAGAPLLEPPALPELEPQLHYEWDGNRFVLTYEQLSLTSEIEELTSGNDFSRTSSEMEEHSSSSNDLGPLATETTETPCDPDSETMQVFGNEFRCLDILDWCSQLSEFGQLAHSCSCACWGLAEPPPAADR